MPDDFEILKEEGCPDWLSEKLAELEAECFSSPWSAASFKGAAESPFTALYTAYSKRELIGFCVASSVSDEGEIQNIAVRPDAQRRGIGRALLDRTLADMRKKGIKNVYLEVRLSGAPARALYLSRGFYEIGLRKGYYKSPTEDAILMRSEL